jgi:hypothetical protein
LNASIHAPSNNSNNNKGKGKQVNNDVNPQLINTLTKAMDRLEFLTGQLTVWQLAIKNLDKRIIRIEQTLELAPIEQQEKQAPKSVQPPPSNTSSDNNFNKSSATNNNKNDALASTASNSNAVNASDAQNLPSFEDISGVMNEVSSLKSTLGDVIKHLTGSFGSNTSSSSNNI